MDKNPNKPPSKSKVTNISKYLALILRHKAKDFGLSIEASGYIKLEDILNLQQSKKMKITEDIVKELVANDKKGRYQLENRPPSTLFIRAVQGHSMSCVSNEETLTKIENIFKYPTVVHGTDSVAWGFIEKTGLNKMARNAVHFSIGYCDDDHVKSGMRNTCDIFIELNAIEAYYNNIPFYISVNNVILSAGIDGVIPVKYVKKVTKKGVGIIYAEHYVYCIYLDVNNNKAVIYKEGIEVQTQDNVSFKDSESLNQLGNIFISNGNYCREAFIVLIDEDFKEDYCSKISQYTENNKLIYPGLYIDYITSPKDVFIKEFIMTINAKMMEKVQVNWQLYYNHMEKKGGNVIKTQETQPITADYEKLTKEIIKDNTKVKHYIITFVNCTGDNIKEIRYMIMNSNSSSNGNDSDLYNDNILFDNKTTKQGLTAFIDSLKLSLTEKEILNKRLIVCIRKSDKDILIKALTKQSIQIPKLLIRNQIILEEDFFSLILNEANFAYCAIQLFIKKYIQSDDLINSLDIV